jgi:hypothetical protein
VYFFGRVQRHHQQQDHEYFCHYRTGRLLLCAADRFAYSWLWKLLRIGRVSVAYWGVLMPTVISVSTWLPVSSVLSACDCLDRHCVLKVARYTWGDRTISSASTTNICIPVYCAQHLQHPRTSHVPRNQATGLLNVAYHSSLR